MVFAPGKISLLNYAYHLIFLKVASFQATRKIKCTKEEKNANISLFWINQICCDNHNSFIYSIFLKFRASRNDIISYKKSF